MPTDEPDAYQVWHSSQAANKGSNAISYKNPRVDEILKQSGVSSTRKSALKYIKSFSKSSMRSSLILFCLCANRFLRCIAGFKTSRFFPPAYDLSIGGCRRGSQKFASTIAPQ